MKQKFDIEMLPIKKRKKGQKHLDADVNLMNTLNSVDRQPIESFFNWLIEKTDIQTASKVRATKGLLTHIYGKLAAAFLALIFNF